MLTITKGDVIGGLELSKGKLAEYIIDATNDEPCTFVIEGVESDLVIVAEFEDVPSNLIFFNLSDNFMAVIEHSSKEVLRELERIGHIKSVFTADIKMKVVTRERQDIIVIN